MLRSFSLCESGIIEGTLLSEQTNQSMPSLNEFIQYKDRSMDSQLIVIHSTTSKSKKFIFTKLDFLDKQYFG